MKKIYLLSLAFVFVCTHLLAQHSKMRYEIEAQAIGTTHNVVPFWMRSNQFGSVPSNGASGSFIGRAYKDYDSTRTSIFDWAAGIEGRANAGKDSELLLIEGFVKVKAGAFQLTAGRTKDVMGLNGDTSLTSGNFSVSGNALGIPKVEISIPNYYRLPILKGLFSIKGNFAHGWVGKQELRNRLWIGRDSIIGHPPVSTFLHQKSLYVRFGKDDWRAQLYGGLNHQAYWGNEATYYGSNYDISEFKNFIHVLTGTTFENGKVPGSKVGNHLGSVDIGMNYKFTNLNLAIYRQFFYDAGALGHLANIKDGLTGIAITNQNSGKNLSWKKLLLEVVYSKNQAGELESKITPSGDEDYYNNHIYRKGWTYNDANLGSPFITQRDNGRKDLVNDPRDFFINNRVFALHFGTEIVFNHWSKLIKLSFSNNFGTYKTSAIGSSIGSRRDPPLYGIFETTKQLSIYIEGNRPLNESWTVGYAAALDRGDLLYNSFGAVLKIKKSIR